MHQNKTSTFSKFTTKNPKFIPKRRLPNKARLYELTAIIIIYSVLKNPSEDVLRRHIVPHISFTSLTKTLLESLKNIPYSEYKKAISDFEYSLKFANNSCSGCCRTLIFCW